MYMKNTLLYLKIDTNMKSLQALIENDGEIPQE